MKRTTKQITTLCALSVAAQTIAGGPSVPTRCIDFQLDGPGNGVDLDLFAGGFEGRLTGQLTLRVNDPGVPGGSPAVVGVSVQDAQLIGSSWLPDTQILDEPTLFLINTNEASTGAWNPTTGAIAFSLYLFSPNAPVPVNEPIELAGTLSNATGLNVSGDNGPVPDAGVTLEIRAREFQCRREVFFSTEIGFTSGATNPTPIPVSDGDLLSVGECVVRTNEMLTSQLGIMPIAPDVGLDAVSNVPGGPIYFSIEEPVFSETLGQISDGDLLSNAGAIIRTNEELREPFWPIPGNEDVGLDALHVGQITPFLDSGGFLFFSVERDFWSEQHKTLIRHGDLLAEPGIIFRRNCDLVAPFQPLGSGSPCNVDYGLDAVYIARDGEIWFSVETGFMSGTHGFISDGAILSDQGYVVAENLELLSADCAPLEDLDNFGLDALDRRRCVNCLPNCRPDINGDGYVNSADLAALLGAWGSVCLLPCPEDINRDGVVNSSDLAILLGAWGPCP